jgi:hypothetical protein
MAQGSARSLDQAFAELMDRANVALNLSAGPPTIENKRLGVAALLILSAQFFAPCNAQLAYRFFELHSAIADLNVGIVDPLLVPTPVENRPGDPSGLWRTRARVALALHARMLSGRSLTVDDAATYIAREFPSAALLAGTKSKNFAKTIIGWRKDFMSRRIKNLEAAEVFAVGKEVVEGLVGERRPKELLDSFVHDQLARAAQVASELSPSS